ncbi:MAG: ribosome biogenesis GTPase YlqF [Lachnospiraceae bacterium]|nr:ribosome biogenesis GTPase YlqF [Lachnospiraceae bacterium]
MNIQWYPGHMTKAVRMMEENMKLIDLVIEILDARIPLSSRNPDIDRLANNKMRMVILNKADLANDTLNKEWVSYFESVGIKAVLYNSKSREGMNALLVAIRETCREKIERDRRRGIKNRSVKAMIVGIPNVGKSTFINNLAKRNAAVVGNKPGVTKGKQWIHISNELDLLDTPGILWPKFDDQKVGLRIGFIGSINDEILPSEELAYELIRCLYEISPEILKSRYSVTYEIAKTDEDCAKVLEEIATNRKCFKKGEEPDLKKAADLLSDEFRSGKLGRISLEVPPRQEK